MAENQAKHRQCIEQKIVAASSRDSLSGIVSAFLICMTALILGTYVILSGHPASGTILSAGSIGGLVSTFIYGTRENRKTRNDNSSDEID